MARLTFKNDGLRKIMEANKNASTFRNSFGHAYRAYQKAVGKAKMDDDIPKEYYETKTPGIWLVKDSGIYIMATAMASENTVVYAEGYNPEQPDCYDKCRDAVGGDDFVEQFDLTPAMETLVNQGMDMVINITSTRINLGFKMPKRKK